VERVNDVTTSTNVSDGRISAVCSQS